MKLNKRILSAILAAMMILMSAAMTACSNNNAETGKNEDTPGAQNVTPTDVEAEPEEELSDYELRQRIPDNVPEMKFNGAELRVQTTDGDQYEEEIVAEELNGDACNDAVYNRNVKVEDRFDIKITCQRDGSPYSIPAKIAKAGTDDYHLIGLYDYMSYQPINAQALLNWLTIPYVDLNQPWHNKLANDDATVNGILYTVCSDLATTSMTYTHCVFANLDLATNYGYAASDLYGLVNEGKWTIDQVMSMAETMYVDLNGNGKSDIAGDQFGFGYQVTNPADVWFNAFGGHYVGRDDDGNVIVTFMDDKTVSELEKLLDFHYNNKGFAKLSTQYDEQKWFLNGQLVFSPMRFYAAFATLRDMESPYTMLPYPKWDEAQQNYYTNADDKFTVFAIATSLYGQIDFIGPVYEVLCAESYKTVYPAYYDVALKGKYSTDQETADMVELIMAGRMFDFSFQFGESVFQRIPYMFRDCINDNNPNIASKFQGIQKAMKKQMEKIFTKVYELEP
ncbi:MAG: hypothetical protein K6A33_07495 [Clostridiales bacterium]|nr:hypothetical protein [Clostridiales bacterium]